MTTAFNFVSAIVHALRKKGNEAKAQFSANSKEVGVRYCCIDELLPDSDVHLIYTAFPEPSRMRFISSFRERKYTSKNFNDFDPVLKEITFAFQSKEIISVVEDITDIKEQIPDPTLYAGGLSMMDRSHFLNPHIDNSHDASRRYYRTLNLLYYVTPDWSLENGGHLELWDRTVSRKTTVVSKFNRLVIMETNPWSWHSVSPVAHRGIRCCVSNYYFSPVSPIGREYFNVTSFSARPEQRVRRAMAWVDNRFRQAIRKLAPEGLGKKDIYHGDGN